MNKLVSSANKTKFAPWIFNRRSFLYSKNKRGPTFEPYGTMCFISLFEELYLMYRVSMITLVYFNKLYSMRQI